MHERDREEWERNDGDEADAFSRRPLEAAAAGDATASAADSPDPRAEHARRGKDYQSGDR